MIKYIENHPVLAIVLVVFLMLLVHLDVPNITIMEARNFISAREMINDGNWILTTMNGEARYQKPPLPTWLTAISGILLGAQNLFALRLPSALMVCFTGLYLYKFSNTLSLSKVHSLRIGLILVSSFYIVAIINEAPWDIYAHGFMLAGIYYIFKIIKNENFKWKHVLLAGLFVGCSMMSKGPVAIYALLLPFLITFGIVYKYKELKKKAAPIVVTMILFLVLGSSWYLYIRLADPETFLAIATKETGNWSSYNVKPFYYYWSFFTQSGIWTIPALISLIYPYMIKRVTNKKVYRFSFWWTIIAVILLSLIPEKKARYLVPVLIPLAINTSFYFEFLMKQFKDAVFLKDKIPVYFNFVLIGLISFGLPFGIFFFIDGVLDNYLWSFLSVAILSFILGTLFFIALKNRNTKLAFYTTVLFMVVIPLFGLPITKGLNNNAEFQAINSLYKFEQENQIKTYSIGDLTPELIWDYNGIIPNIYKLEKLQLPSSEKFGLLVMNRDVTTILAQLKQDFEVEFIETYDLNVGSKKKERLIRQFYLIAKK